MYTFAMEDDYFNIYEIYKQKLAEIESERPIYIHVAMWQSAVQTARELNLTEEEVERAIKICQGKESVYILQKQQEETAENGM
jgi:hypothetical protein